MTQEGARPSGTSLTLSRAIADPVSIEATSAVVCSAVRSESTTSSSVEEDGGAVTSVQSQLTLLSSMVMLLAGAQSERRAENSALVVMARPLRVRLSMGDEVARSWKVSLEVCSTRALSRLILCSKSSLSFRIWP